MIWFEEGDVADVAVVNRKDSAAMIRITGTGPGSKRHNETFVTNGAFKNVIYWLVVEPPL